MIRTLTNREGLVLNQGDRVSIDDKPATIVGFHRDMIRVLLDAMPTDPITVDANWRVSLIES